MFQVNMFAVVVFCVVSAISHALAGRIGSCSAEVADFDIRSFGARETNAPGVNAAAVQQAIDKASGGGRVIVPAGTFVCGTIWLKPKVELHLEKGAVLKASPDMSDYNAEDAYPENFGVPSEYWRGLHLIIAREAHGSSITGPGIVDGNGDVFYEEKPNRYRSWMVPGADCWWNGIRWAKDKVKLRPGQLIVFVKSDGVSVRDLTIRNACCWSLHFWGCDGVRVTDYRVRNGENDGNSDGLDIDCSRNVEILRADIDTGDDAIAIRASGRNGQLGRPEVTDGVRIRDCRLRSTSSVIRIGVGAGTIRNVTIEDVTCDRGGTSVHFSCCYGDTAKGGVDIENLTVRNARFTNCARGLQFFVGGDRQKFGVRNVVFENCAFGKPTVIHNLPGCRFPLSESSIVFRDTTFGASPADGQ